MKDNGYVFTVFTKPWKDLTMEDLATHVKRLGFDGVEFPLRPGYQVEPGGAAKGLPKLARVFADHGLSIESIAGPTDEPTFAACAEARVPVIRIMFGVRGEKYREAEVRIGRELDAMEKLAARYGVTVGIQNHSGDFAPANANGLMRLCEGRDPRHIAAVWDAAHNALAGEEPEIGLDLVWSHLRMVNLKNAFWRRASGPEAEVVRWDHYYTSGRQGIASWPRIAAFLKERGWRGVVCLTAEYTAEDQVNRLAAEDIAFARSLFSDRQER
jgi:sugar phosphate isomerase/epimerase